MWSAIEKTLGKRTALALVVAMVITSPPALAQNATITMKDNYSPGEQITFGYSNAPNEQGVILIVPKGAPINETSKTVLRNNYYGRFHYGSKRRGVVETKTDMSWGPLKAGEYELRIYGGNDNLVGQQPFSIGNTTPLETTIDAAAIEQPPDEQPSVPPTTPNEVTGGPAIKTVKKVYAPKEGVVVDFSNAPGNGRDFIILVPKGTPDNQTRVVGATFTYLQGRLNGTGTIVGLPAGEYEARLYGQDSDELLARHPFLVE